MSIADLRIKELLAAELAREECVGFTAKIRVVPGQQDASAVVALRRKIASAFEVGAQHVEITPDPLNESIAHLTVAFPARDGTHPLDREVIWERPTIDL